LFLQSAVPDTFGMECHRWITGLGGLASPCPDEVLVTASCCAVIYGWGLLYRLRASTLPRYSHLPSSPVCDILNSTCSPCTMDTFPCRQLLCQTGATLIDATQKLKYDDECITPLVETLCADSWICCQFTVRMFGRVVQWAVSFFFCPLISDVISMAQVAWQLTSISSYFIILIIFIIIRCFRRFIPLRRVLCLLWPVIQV